MRLNIAGLCFTDENGVLTTYNVVLVATSFVIAALGSYATLEMIGRMRATRGARSRSWQAGSAVALGGSIWSMHFTAMLAMSFPFAVTYSIGPTALSLVIAIAAAGLGLEIAGNNSRNFVRIGIAGAIIGLSIAAMHYIGMAAIMFPGTIAYTPGLWGLSILIAISASMAAIWLALTVDDRLERGAAAIIMAAAVCGMHFTGMSSTVLQVGSLPQLESGIGTNGLGIAVVGITVSLVVLALALVSVDRKISADRARESNFRTASAVAIADIEQKVFSLNEDLEQKRTLALLLSHVFTLVDAPMAIIADKGEFLLTNPALDNLLDCSPGTLVGRLSISYATPVCRDRLLKLRNQQIIDLKPYSTDAQFFRADGSVFCMNLTSAVVDEESLRRFRIVTLTRPISAARPLDLPRFVIGSKIKFIGLEEMETALGADWPAVSDRIMNAAERIVRSCLESGEACSRSGGCSFLLSFETESEEFASARVTVIEQKLREGLLNLGEDVAATEFVTATTAVVIPDDAMPGGKLAQEIIDSALDVGIQATAQVVTRAKRVPFQLGGCIFEPVLTCQRAEFIGHTIDLLPPNSGQDDQNLALQSIDLQRKIIVAAEQAGRDISDRSLNLMFVALSVESLLKKSSLEMHLALYRNASSVVRSRLVLLLHGWPPDLPFGRVMDLTTALNPVCRTLGLRLSGLTMPKVDLGYLGNPYVAIDARQVGVDCRKNSKLDRFVTQIHAKRGRVLIRQVPSMSVVRELQSLGMDLVSIETGRRPT
jgi:NO-binding membrane sensor protein with MHYT domain